MSVEPQSPVDHAKSGIPQASESAMPGVEVNIKALRK
jgi:hypothetical protein